MNLTVKEICRKINGIGVAFGVDRLIELIEMDNTNNE